MTKEFVIRPYHGDDLPVLHTWWEARGEALPTHDMMPIGTSYVIEYGDKPVASMCWIKTNCPAVAYSANFVSDPSADEKIRRTAVEWLFDFILGDVRAAGFHNLVAFGYKPKVVSRFKEMGFRVGLTNVTSFVMPL